MRHVQRTLDFYRTHLHMEPMEQRPGKWALRFGTSMISLQPADRLPPIAQRTAAGTGNFCLPTRTPVKEIVRALEAAGVEIVEGPGPKDGAVGPIQSIYFHDPDGNLVEVANSIAREP